MANLLVGKSLSTVSDDKYEILENYAYMYEILTYFVDASSLSM